MFGNKFWILTYYDSITDKCSNIWRCFAALCSMFPIDVDYLIFVFNARTSPPNPTVICHPFFSFCKVEGIPSDTHAYSCFLYVSHIDCNVGLFDNIRTSGFNIQDQVNIIHIQNIFWTYVYMPSQLSIPCLLQTCACLVSHLAVNIIQRMEQCQDL